MSVFQRAWRLFAPLIVIAGIVVGAILINKPFGGKLLASFINAEGAIGLWTASGWNFPAAIGIGLFCSTCDLVMWCWIFRDLHVLLEKAETFIVRYETQVVGRPKAKSDTRIFMARMLFFLVMRPSSCNALKARYRTQIRIVALPAIALMGFCPGCVWPAIFLMYALELGMVPAFLALAGGNAIKVVLFGGIDSHLTGQLLRTNRFGHFAAVGLAFLAIILIQRILEKWMRKRIMQTAPLPS